MATHGQRRKVRVAALCAGHIRTRLLAGSSLVRFDTPTQNPTHKIPRAKLSSEGNEIENRTSPCPLIRVVIVEKPRHVVLMLILYRSVHGSRLRSPWKDGGKRV